jgi:hypothetical protein
LLLDATGRVLSKQEYDDVLDRAQRFSYRFTSITLLAGTFFTLVVGLPIGTYLIDALGLGGLASFFCLLLIATPLIVLSIYVKRKEDRIQRRFFSKYMLARGLRPDACLMCGYTLRGVQGNRCPECGEALASRAE